MEETRVVGHATVKLKELSLQPCEAKTVRKMNTLQRKTSNRDIFSAARKSDSHQQQCGGTSPGDSQELQQPTVQVCPAQKGVPQPSGGYNKEREELGTMPKPQNDVREQIVTGAAVEV